MWIQVDANYDLKIITWSSIVPTCTFSIDPLCTHMLYPVRINHSRIKNRQLLDDFQTLSRTSAPHINKMYRHQRRTIQRYFHIL